MIRPVRDADAAAIRDIYNFYVENTVITFDEAPVTAPAIEEQIREITACFPWLVWEEAGEVLGYAYLHQWKERRAYRFSAEDSIYIKQGFLGQGMGKRLMIRLLEEAPKAGLHAVVAGITIPNKQSISLHRKFGFKKIAHFPEIGYKLGKWLDVGYWERILPSSPSPEHIP
ncbi:MAG: GNAT family N-acetyltransferase [Spirochaetaceae bacterium]|jgi:phosphinothricin acetyltransferase|nr:GNAT family N-acetyltransferase [Spirochaetaceae bacterium]